MTLLIVQLSETKASVFSIFSVKIKSLSEFIMKCKTKRMFSEMKANVIFRFGET